MIGIWPLASDGGLKAYNSLFIPQIQSYLLKEEAGEGREEEKRGGRREERSERRVCVRVRACKREKDQGG